MERAGQAEISLLKCLLRKQQAFCLFWRGDHPAIYRSRAERRRKKGLSADLLHQLRRTLGLELIGIGVQALQRVYGPAAGAELVLHIGGELIEIFLRAGIAAEEMLDCLDAPVRRLGAVDAPLPAGRYAEKMMVPSVEEIVGAVKEIV